MIPARWRAQLGTALGLGDQIVGLLKLLEQVFAVTLDVTPIDPRQRQIPQRG